MRAFFSVAAFDVRNLARDQFLYLLIGMVSLLYGAMILAGINREAWGGAAIAPYMPYVLAAAMVSAPVSYGLLFGLLLIDELESGVRAALFTTPIAPTHLILMRLPVAAGLIGLLTLIFLTGLNMAWNIGLALAPLIGAAGLTGLLGAVVAVSISTFAGNRLEALALGKFYSSLTMPPLLSYVLADDSMWRWGFHLFPTMSLLEAYEAARAGAPLAVSAGWLAWGAVFASALLALSMRRYLRRSFHEM